MASPYNINPFCLSLWLSFTAALSLFIPTLSQTANYIVHMDSSAMPKAFSTHHSWHLATLSFVFADSKIKTTTNFNSKLLYSYKHVMSGFSAHLSPSELEALKKSPGYISSIKDLPVKPDTTHSPTYLGLTSNSGAWKVSNYGKDIIIGVVDTGVWPESKSFSDKGMPKIPKRWKGVCESGQQFNSSMCNNKLIGARFFNKGLIANKHVNMSMNSTRDNDGHGTHTSSTAAGNFVEGASYFGYAPGTAVGVAPRAHLAIYKALWSEGSFTSDIIAAIDQAIIDGVDVLSLSLGLDGLPLYEDPIALATFAAVEKNIFVAGSAGNDGPFHGSLHNGTPWLLTVAAGTIDRDFEAVLTLGNGVSVTGTALYPGNYSSSRTTIVFRGECFTQKELSDLQEKIVVCQEENNSLEGQFEDIGIKNVTGAIFITNTNDTENYIPSQFPGILMTPKDGETIKAYIKSTKKPVASMEFKKTNLGVKGAPSLTRYSSRGPFLSSPSVMKPDIMAPGSLILAAWPDNIAVATINAIGIFSNFNIDSGTSMACPHAAGVAALIKKAHPDWSPAAIRSAIMTTADTVDNTLGPIRDIGFTNRPATPLDMGAGQINPNKALDPGLVYDANTTDYVNLLCALNFTQKQIQIITKSPNNDCSSPSLDLNYPSFLAYFNSTNGIEFNLRKVEEFYRTVTNVGDAISNYTANLTPLGHGLNVSVIPNKLEFKAKNQKLSFKLVIEGPRKVDDDIISGYLNWVEAKGKHVVKSPIAVTSLRLDTMTMGPN